MAGEILTLAQLGLVRTTFNAAFNEGLKQGEVLWPRIAGRVPSTGSSNTYGWFSEFPQFQKWTGQRVHKELAERAYRVTNDLYTATADVSRSVFEDGEWEPYSAVARSQGQAAVDHQNRIMFAALADGFAEKGYDDKFFFDAQHPVYANENGTGAVTNVSNVQAGAGQPWVMLCTKRAAKPLYLQERVTATFESQVTAASDSVYEFEKLSFGGRWRGNSVYGFWQCAFGSKADLTLANFEAAYDSMISVKADGLVPMGIVPDLLVVGPSNRVKAEAILAKQYINGGESNTNYKRLDLLVSPWLG